SARGDLRAAGGGRDAGLAPRRGRARALVSRHAVRGRPSLSRTRPPPSLRHARAGRRRAPPALTPLAVSSHSLDLRSSWPARPLARVRPEEAARAGLRARVERLVRSARRPRWPRGDPAPPHARTQTRASSRLARGVPALRQRTPRGEAGGRSRQSLHPRRGGRTQPRAPAGDRRASGPSMGLADAGRRSLRLPRLSAQAASGGPEHRGRQSWLSARRSAGGRWTESSRFAWPRVSSLLRRSLAATRGR